jgi:hypothetical protein
VQAQDWCVTGSNRPAGNGRLKKFEGYKKQLGRNQGYGSWRCCYAGKEFCMIIVRMVAMLIV